MNIDEKIKNETKAGTGYFIEIEATSEAITKAMTYLYCWYGKEEFYTDIHIKGNKAYIEM